MSELYTHLSRAEQEARLEALTEQYWNAVDFLAGIATQRATLMNEMQQTNQSTGETII